MHMGCVAAKYGTSRAGCVEAAHHVAAAGGQHTGLWGAAGWLVGRSFSQCVLAGAAPKCCAQRDLRSTVQQVAGRADAFLTGGSASRAAAGEAGIRQAREHGGARTGCRGHRCARRAAHERAGPGGGCRSGSASWCLFPGVSVSTACSGGRLLHRGGALHEQVQCPAHAERGLVAGPDGRGA